jgi:replicative DNA helicase
MSAGLSFIRACIDNGARSTFATAPVEFFTEEETRTYQFVVGFLSRYGALPSMDALRENGLALPVATGPVDYHLQRISDRAVYRSYADNQGTLLDALQRNDMDRVREVVTGMYGTIQRVGVYRDTFSLEEAIQQAWDAYETARANPGLQGQTYGWSVLDELTGGLRNGDVATIVARPGLGKSFTVTRAAVTAWRQGASVVFVSMEMTAIETARRIMSMELGANPDHLLRGRLDDWAHADAQRYVETAVPGRAPFTLLVGDLTKSLSDVDALIQEHAPDYVCIDASYLLRPVTNFKGRRWEAAADVGEALKGLAIRRNKPILQTVQFNRSSKPDEEMDLSQIGGTDVIGQVSALVLGMRRGPAPHERTRRRYVVLKNRHGPDHLTFQTNFLFSPFNMEEVDEEEDRAADADWDGTRTAQPPTTDWAGA